MPSHSPYALYSLTNLVWFLNYIRIRDLFLKLKELRNELAREAGIPAYAVFHNSTLEGLARLKPTTRRGAMNVHGIGEQKAAKYLDDFLEVIAEHCEV